MSIVTEEKSPASNPHPSLSSHMVPEASASLTPSSSAQTSFSRKMLKVSLQHLSGTRNRPFRDSPRLRGCCRAPMTPFWGEGPWVAVWVFHSRQTFQTPHPHLYVTAGDKWGCLRADLVKQQHLCVISPFCNCNISKSELLTV